VNDIRIAHERNFDTLLLDSTYFLLQARAAGVYNERSQSLARASIAFSLLMLEAAANTCIEHLDLAGSVHNDIDRLSVLAKYDFYLRTQFRKKCLPRDAHQIEWLKELKGLRDGIVHLKTQKVEWVGPEDGEQVAETPTTKSLKISTNPTSWGESDAVSVARGVHGFLKFFFKECCGYGPSKVASLLFSEDKVPGGVNHFYPYLDRTALHSLRELQVDISYVRTAR
jgi:hypothetical protein